MTPIHRKYASGREWEGNRATALKRVLASAEVTDASDSIIEERHAAMTALVVAHLATTFELEGGAPTRWSEACILAFEKLMAASDEHAEDADDPMRQHELNAALDMFALSYVAMFLEKIALKEKPS